MKRTILSILLMLPALAHAHAGAGEGFLRGLQHPLGGIDHVLAMVAVGIWAGQRGGRALWLLPATFVALVAIGGLLGASQVPMPFAEQGVLASILVLALLATGTVRMPLAAAAAVVAFFAVCHGSAHGAEMPAAASRAGFLAATAFLHGAGIAVALLIRRVQRKVAWS